MCLYDLIDLVVDMSNIILTIRIIKHRNVKRDKLKIKFVGKGENKWKNQDSILHLQQKLLKVIQ